jgi:hypothetical protein
MKEQHIIDQFRSQHTLYEWRKGHFKEPIFQQWLRVRNLRSKRLSLITRYMSYDWHDAHEHMADQFDQIPAEVRAWLRGLDEVDS